MTPRHTSLATLLDGREGLRVVADVQGQYPLLAPMLEDARAKNYAVLSLGDLVDRGPDSPSVVRAILPELMIPGNHDDKFWRLMQGRDVKVGPELQETLDQFAALPDGEDLKRVWAGWLGRLPLWIQAGRWFFVHGGFHPNMLATPAPTLARRGHGGLVARALYGQTDGSKTDTGFQQRLYDWIDQIPAGLTVVIGHDIQSLEAPVYRTGLAGGRLVNLDTGADRGGPLSYLDIPTAELGDPVAFEPVRTMEDRPQPQEAMLTLLVGPVAAGKTTWILANAADPASVLSTDALRQQLFGDFQKQEGGDRIFFTLYDRAQARLAKGLPVVIDSTHCRRADRIAAAGLVPKSWTVRYVVLDRTMEEKLRDRGWRREELVRRYAQMFRSQIHEILAGDGLPNVEVVDLRDEALRKADPAGPKRGVRPPGDAQ